MTAETITPTDTAQKLRIDFLFLDLSTCTRCLGADRSIETALDAVHDVLETTGIDVEVMKILVQSAEQARALRFVSSPTIRVNDDDVALELRESSCGSEACTDGCGDQIACRVWVHRGREYTEPPVAMLVDAILGHVYGDAPSSAGHRGTYDLPENLTRFFAARTPSAEPRDSGCCPASEQQSCCAADAKEACCGAASGEGCGCQ